MNVIWNHAMKVFEHWTTNKQIRPCLKIQTKALQHSAWVRLSRSESYKWVGKPGCTNHSVKKYVTNTTVDTSILEQLHLILWTLLICKYLLHPPNSLSSARNMSNGIRWLNLWCCKKSQGNNASGQPQLLYLHVSSKFQDSFQRKRYWSGDANLLWLGFEDVRMIVDIHGYTVFLFQLWGWGFHGDIIGKDELLCIWESPFQVHPLATFWSKSRGEFKIQIYNFMHCDILKQKLTEATDSPRFVNMIAISFNIFNMIW